MIPIISCQTNSIIRTKSDYNFPSLSHQKTGGLSKNFNNQSSSLEAPDGDQSATSGATQPEDRATSGRRPGHIYNHSFDILQHRSGKTRVSQIRNAELRRTKKEESGLDLVAARPSSTRRATAASSEAVNKMIPIEADSSDPKNVIRNKKKQKKEPNVVAIAQQPQMQTMLVISCAECSKELHSSNNLDHGLPVYKLEDLQQQNKQPRPHMTTADFENIKNLKNSSKFFLPCSHTIDLADKQLQLLQSEETNVTKLQLQWTSLASLADSTKVFDQPNRLEAKPSPSSSGNSMTSLWAMYGSMTSRDVNGKTGSGYSSDNSDERLTSDDIVDKDVERLIDRKSSAKDITSATGNTKHNNGTRQPQRPHSPQRLPPPAQQQQAQPQLSTTVAQKQLHVASTAHGKSRKKPFAHSKSAIFPAKLSIIFEKSSPQSSERSETHVEHTPDARVLSQSSVSGASRSTPTTPPPYWATRPPPNKVVESVATEGWNKSILKVDLEGLDGAGETSYKSSVVPMDAYHYQKYLSKKRLLLLGQKNSSATNATKSTKKSKYRRSREQQQRQSSDPTSGKLDSKTTVATSANHYHQKWERRADINLQTAESFSDAFHSSDSLTVKLYDDDDVDGRWYNEDKLPSNQKLFGADALDDDSICLEKRHDCRKNGCDRLRINVCGQLFETRRAVLERHPETLLGNSFKRQAYFDNDRRELFFDRHRPSFEAIFSYYQHGGRLRRPYHVPSDVFLDELIFFELEEETVEEYKRSEGYIVDETPMPHEGWMRGVWCLFEDPQSSRAAFYIAVLSVLMTLISIVIFCVETLPYFDKSHCVDDQMPNFLDPFFIIETTCTVWFTIEAIARFISCPDKIDFWKDFKNIVDVTAVLPYYWTLLNVLWSMSCAGAKTSASLSFLRVIRLIRVFKLTKHSVGLQVLLLTFRASLEGLGLFLVALMVSLLVFSSAVYYAEYGNPESNMKSIPDAFWWAIITMTTVGYGDKVPLGVTGRLIGSACAITGVLTLAIPVPIITGHFNRFYSHKTGRGRHV